MGSIQDITNLIRKGPELISRTNSMKLNRKSVVASAKDATFQYPFLISDTNPIDMATAAVQMFDRVYAEYTKTYLSVNAMYDMTLDPTPTDYLRKLHQNVKFEMAGMDDVNELSNTIRGWNAGEYELYLNESSGYGILFNRANKGLDKVMASNRKALESVLDTLDLQPFTAMEADDDVRTPMGGVGDLADAIVTGTAVKNADDRRRGSLMDSDRGKHPQLADRDVKKSNDAMPYAINVRLVAVNDKKEFVQFIDIVVGVKTIMHVIPSDEMVENIGRAIQNKSLIFKMARWTSGEISLVKDIILNLSDIKEDAFNRQKKNPYFAALKKLRRRKFTLRNGTVPTGLIPNATIAISRNEVDALKEQYAVDVMDSTIAKKLIDSLFLMAFVIIDEGSDTVSVFYEDSGSFETYSVDVLQRENRAAQKQVNKMIGSMSLGV